MKKSHIEKHDFGYGKSGQFVINKLSLRNFKDCRDYLNDIVSNYFLAYVHNNKLQFLSNYEKVEIVVKKIK